MTLNALQNIYRNPSDLCSQRQLPSTPFNTVLPIGGGQQLHFAGCGVSFSAETPAPMTAPPAQHTHLNAANDRVCPVNGCEQRLGAGNLVLERSRHIAQKHTVEVSEGPYKGQIKCNIDENCDRSFPKSYTTSNSTDVKRVFDHVKRIHPEFLK